MDFSLANRRVEAYRMGRKRRGDIRIFLLWSLLERPMHGYELIQFLSEKTFGLWTPSPGSVYPTLQLLEEQGMVRSSEKDGKKVYTITDEGRKLADKLPKGSFEKDPKQSEAIINLREANGMLRLMMRKIITEGSIDDLNSAAKIASNAKAQLAKVIDDLGK